MDGEKCHRKTPKNHSKPVKFLTVRVYGYNDGNKRIEISRIDLEDLKNEIISQGLEWVINDEKIAKKTLEKDKNKIKLKKTLSEDHEKKLSEIAKVEQYGIKNPQAKYTLWDSSKCYFSKRDLIRSNKDNKNLRKVFLCKYNGYRMPIGYFHEFLSCEIISDIIVVCKYNFKFFMLMKKLFGLPCLH